jgi:ATP-dependent Clp protease ATP-binding subunit ClpB
MFSPLSGDEIKGIVLLQLNQLKQKLEKENIHLGFTNEALAFLARAGYEPQYGARPVKRTIQRELLNELSRQIIAGKINKDALVQVDSNGDKLLFVNH